MESRQSVYLSAVLLSAAIFAVTFAGRTTAAPLNVQGEYVEARTCDVWTGPCFSNGEINLQGDHAVMGWVIGKGSWNGVRLDGMKVAASIDAEGTLGTNAEGKVRAVVYVDKRASKEQGEALVALARQLAPKYLQNIVKVHCDKTISYRRKGQKVDFQVGREVVLRTKDLSPHRDTICGNEEKAYPSLASTRSAKCAKTVTHIYRGSDLGPRWSAPGARSAMVGSFEL